MFTQLTPQLYVAQSRLYSMNSGIFVSEGQALLIDPCLFPDEIQAMVEFVAEQSLRPEALLITHSHWDHVFGPPFFVDVPVIAHDCYTAEVEIDRENILHKVQAWEQAYEVQWPRPFVIPSPHQLVGHESQIEIGASQLRLLHIPGHAADQLAVYHEESATLWAADLLSDIEIPFIFDSLPAYENTLSFLAGLDIHTLIPGHGQATQDHEEIANRFLHDRQYLTQLREYVETAVKKGQTVEETLVACASMYYRVPEENRGPHERNVRFVYDELTRL
ncbi:MAG: MBL fold metallo-hydrolase [Anaerolineales bacterium]|nr:MBL fold metallo-hydrolase [Anaerolineales bacterium]